MVKEWSESKSVQDIQVFLDFANFYFRFIKGFNKIAALLMSILKTTISSKVLTVNRVNNIKSGDRLKRVKARTRRSKCQKLAKLRKLSKSEKSKTEKLKRLSKIGNSPNFDSTKTRVSFLTPYVRMAFNRLRLAFMEGTILQHFDSECHI